MGGDEQRPQASDLRDRRKALGGDARRPDVADLRDRRKALGGDARRPTPSDLASTSNVAMERLDQFAFQPSQLGALPAPDTDSEKGALPGPDTTKVFASAASKEPVRPAAAAAQEPVRRQTADYAPAGAFGINDFRGPLGSAIDQSLLPKSILSSSFLCGSVPHVLPASMLNKQPCVQRRSAGAAQPKPGRSHPYSGGPAAGPTGGRSLCVAKEDGADRREPAPSSSSSSSSSDFLSEGDFKQWLAGMQPGSTGSPAGTGAVPANQNLRREAAATVVAEDPRKKELKRHDSNPLRRASAALLPTPAFAALLPTRVSAGGASSQLRDDPAPARADAFRDADAPSRSRQQELPPRGHHSKESVPLQKKSDKPKPLSKMAKLLQQCEAERKEAKAAAAAALPGDKAKPEASLAGPPKQGGPSIEIDFVKLDMMRYKMDAEKREKEWMSQPLASVPGLWAHEAIAAEKKLSAALERTHFAEELVRSGVRTKEAQEDWEEVERINKETVKKAQKEEKKRKLAEFNTRWGTPQWKEPVKK